ncbi:MAG: helicase-related protein [Eggerthella lenta]
MPPPQARAGYTAEAIHSDRSQAQRRRALDNFAAGKTGVLVATDVLARGIDVEEVDCRTMTCPPSPRITSTASAARVERAPRASPCRS